MPYCVVSCCDQQSTMGYRGYAVCDATCAEIIEHNQGPHIRVSVDSDGNITIVNTETRLTQVFDANTHQCVICDRSRAPRYRCCSKQHSRVYHRLLSFAKQQQMRRGAPAVGFVQQFVNPRPPQGIPVCQTRCHYCDNRAVAMAPIPLCREHLPNSAQICVGLNGGFQVPGGMVIQQGFLF